MRGYSHLFIIDKDNNVLVQQNSFWHSVPKVLVNFDDKIKDSIIEYYKLNVGIDLDMFSNHIHPLETIITKGMFNEIFIFFVADVYKESWNFTQNIEWVNINKLILDSVQTECIKIIKNNLNIS